MTNHSGLAQSAAPGLVWLDRFKNAVIDLFFPPHCVACHRLGAWLCVGCLDAIETIYPPVCPRCGLPLNDTRANTPVCAYCREAPPQLDGLLAYAFHSGPLREAIHQFKYQDLRSLAGPLGELMAEGWTVLAPAHAVPDVIVPVPLHPSRQRQRGYNQAALLARELGACLHHPVVEDALVRTRPTTPQVDLNAEERRANVHGAFECRGTRLSGQRVLLVDDVYTTGSTLESASVALREAGTLSVWAYTLARARPGTPQA